MTKAINIMSENLVKMDKKRGFKGAIDIMLKTKADYILVMDKSKPIGLITERDILRELVLNTKKLPSIKLDDSMSKDMTTITLDEDISEISTIMEEEDIRHLPVKENNKIVGMIRASDVFRETRDIQIENIKINRYQNIQTWIIIAFFLFFLAYLMYRLFFI